MALPLAALRNRLSVGIIVLLYSLAVVNSVYEDDGYFDPRWVKPHHFNTEEENLEMDFYDRLLEEERARIAERRQLQTDDAVDDGYVPDPGDGTDDGECTLEGPKFCCTNCNKEKMKLCRKLGGKLLEDKYGRLKKGSEDDDSCTNLEQRAERLDVFGKTKTFRDTPECRIMVYDYTCLWWGSDNAVYSNNCKEDKELPDGTKAEAAFQPCLSYCTQVANTCANRPDWIKLCQDGVICQAVDSTPCVEGPTEAAGSGCPDYPVVSFYNAAVGAKAGVSGLIVSSLLALALIS
ncbi:hypothetical protein TrVE_jg7504 [Triparma verrucosa]|uniref:Uncharacterized protein n=2 Tax=Triparma TaxID=722752 RepID=A0A9W7AN52_9STRA|nr:hypothetical protein TrST_g7969 [Triparma strigata]GMI12323.1 hypothetical protein TrVE_jg7504 [Triparma verrucosa]